MLIGQLAVLRFAWKKSCQASERIIFFRFSTTDVYDQTNCAAANFTSLHFSF